MHCFSAQIQLSIFAFPYPEQDQLKQRDQSLRKQEQEMDSLSFRNQQLARRVELLQDELAMCEAKGKKGKVIQGASTHYVVCYLVIHLTLQNWYKVILKLKPFECVNGDLFCVYLQNKGDSPSQHARETKNVFDEDLQKKIEENERLHIKVSCQLHSVLVCFITPLHSCPARTLHLSCCMCDPVLRSRRAAQEAGGRAEG